jgi:flagellar biosynthesis GTPase FlhF
MTSGDGETRTYRGRSLDELVPQIRRDLGDDAVIVTRRETTSGGLGGFFAKREIEVEARPSAAREEAARLFAERLAEASDQLTPHAPEGPGSTIGAPPAGVGPGPGTVDETVDDLFAAPAAPSGGLASLFNVGREEPAAAAGPPESEPAPPAAEAPPLAPPAPAPPMPGPAQSAPEPAPEPEHAPDPGIAEDAQVDDEVLDLAVVDGDASDAALREHEQPVAEQPPAGPVITEQGSAVTPLPPRAREAAERLVAHGVHPDIAQAVAEQAIMGLLPLLPQADPAELVRDALARRIPIAPLRRGGGVIGFVGPAGAGKTRCVARLAAAYARHGVLPVAVVALRAPDGGAELTRLLAPYGVELHAVDSGAEGAERVASLRGSGLVVVDTPGVSPRDADELRALGAELEALAPEELHLAVPATIAPTVAQELLGGVRMLGIDALVLTHGDETEQLGTVVSLSIETGLPLSYIARGQAVDAGLRPATAAELAAALVS